MVDWITIHFYTKEISLSPIEYCRQKTKESKSSFLAGFMFLIKAKREAMLVLYAFCREVDDVVDDCSEAHIAQTTLNWWRNQVALVYEDNPQPEHPVCLAMVPVVRQFNLPQEEFLAILDGMQMDLQTARYSTFEDLTVYCDHVAGVVGRLIVRILGFKNEQTLLYADKLGLALQLTNIIRDVGEDARLGRIYLPIDDLAQFDVPAAQILAYESNQKFADLMSFQVERALAIYHEAIELLSKEDKGTQKAGLIMGAIYHDLLLTIKDDGVEKTLQQKLSLSGSRKIIVALKACFMGFKP